MARTLLVAVLLALPATGLAKSVVLFPLDARGVAYPTAAKGTELLNSTISSLPKTSVIEPKTIADKIGVNLTEQARSCDYDVFCLVEIGEVVGADFMLIGHLRLATDKKTGEQRELKLIVLDVAKATITEVLIWKIPSTFEGGLEHACRAAGRKLFGRPDTKIAWGVNPPEAQLFFYGEAVKRPEGGGPIPYWSGVYYATLEAEGYQTANLKVELPKSRKKAVDVAYQLQPDLLYVPDKGKDTKVFDKRSQRTGSGVGSDVAGAVETKVSRDLIIKKPWPWIGAGVGVAVLAVGSVLMINAQSKYNTLSTQERYTPGTTVTAEVAMSRRDEARRSFGIGSGLTLAGIGVLVGTGVWILVDYFMSDEEPAP